jgi:hypothetical protein
MAQLTTPTTPGNKGDRLLLERQFRQAQRQAIDDELDQRIREHARNVRRWHRAQQFKKRANVPLDFLAVGDSWFDYPLYDNALLYPWDWGIVAQQHNLGILGTPPPLILSLAHWGWASTQVLAWQNQQTMIDKIEAGSWINGNGPDAILASFGGDDIAGDQLAIYLTYGGHLPTASTRFQGVLDLVQASYEDLIAFRDIFAPNAPIFAHCYDFPLASGLAADGLAGPWLKPSFDFALYDSAGAQNVLHDMIQKFLTMLQTLAAVAKNNFYVVNTTGTITPSDWSNEIHPKPDGFYKLSLKFLAELQKHFPGRI